MTVQPFQNPNVVVPSVPPVIRLPAQDSNLVNLLLALGSPAQDANLLALLQQLSNFGAQPFVPNLKSAPILRASEGQSPYILATFPSPGRIWTAMLSFSAATNNSYNAAVSQMYAQLITGSGIVLAVSEISVGGAAAGSTPSTSGPGNSNVQHNGMPVKANDTILLDVNAGQRITNLQMRASGAVNYSIP